MIWNFQVYDYILHNQKLIIQLHDMKVKIPNVMLSLSFFHNIAYRNFYLFLIHYLIDFLSSPGNSEALCIEVSYII